MKKVFIFLTGAAIGSAVTYKLTEKYFNKLVDEEIESVKETFKEKLIEIEERMSGETASDENYTTEEITEPDPAKEEVKKNQEQIDKIIKENGYAIGVDMAAENSESIQVEETTDEEEDDSDYTVPVEVGREIKPPYVITEDEYGEFGNEEQTLILYSDGKLVDENEELIVDPEAVVGDALEEFSKGEFIERIYVRDENNEIDYTILASEKTYSEVYGEEEE